MFFNQPQYKNITMNGITVEVPESNVTVLQQTEAFSIYNDTKNKLSLTSLGMGAQKASLAILDKFSARSFSELLAYPKESKFLVESTKSFADFRGSPENLPR